MTPKSPFFSSILKISVKHFHPALAASLVRDFPRSHNKKLKLIVYFFTVYKDCSWCDRTSERMSFWAITNKFGLAQQDKIDF